MEMIQIYKKKDAVKQVNTQKGPMSYYDFLLDEKLRLESKGRIVKLEGGEKRKHGYTEIGLYVNKLF